MEKWRGEVEGASNNFFGLVKLLPAKWRRYANTRGFIVR